MQISVANKNDAGRHDKNMVMVPGAGQAGEFAAVQFGQQRIVVIFLTGDAVALFGRPLRHAAFPA